MPNRLMNTGKVFSFFCVWCGVVGSLQCRKADVPEAAPRRPVARVFEDVTESAGFTHRHLKPVLDAKLSHINSWVSSVGAAAAAGDYNNDGFIDLYVTTSRKGHPNFLYRNNGDGTFTDVAASAGVADVNGPAGTSMDCVFGDFDNDGWADLYLLRWGEDALFRNRGDGTFEDVTSAHFTRRDGSAGMQWANGNAVIFFDFDLDGRLDIYVGNYFDELDLWDLPHTRIMHDDFEKARNGGHNFLFRQRPDGGFEEVAVQLGVDDPGWTLSVGSADVNNDGLPDLYCADDFGPDQLFINAGNGRFENVTEHAIGFDTKKGMNVDFGDFNNDGWLDIYVTNITTAEYLQEGNMLWHNNGLDAEGRVSLTDISLESGTYDGGWGWAAKFFDYDNDADLDLISLNGFISAGEGNFWYDLASWTVTGDDPANAANWPPIGDRSFSGYEKTRFFTNEGYSVFAERAADVGLDCDRDGRGAVIFDYDNDGDLDVYLANQHQPPTFLRNSGKSSGNWIMVDVKGSAQAGVTRDAIGARVTVVTADGSQIRERDGGSGYSSQSDPRLHFGLGAADKIELIEVRWPDGGLQYVENVAANRLLTIVQDPAKYTDRVVRQVAQPKPILVKDSAVEPAPDLDMAVVDASLSEMEAALESGLTGYALPATYRKTCAQYGRHERSIALFQKLLKKDPDNRIVRLELSSAFVDKIPTCGGLAAIVSKGTLAKKSLNMLDALVEDEPGLWEAYYCRGMNHLHWPRALRHSDDAAADFERCLELQKKAGELRPYYLRAYIGLGDAYAKAKIYDKARKAWRDGLKVFPESKALKDRLAVKGDGALLEFVESKRNLEQPIDTSLAFLDAYAMDAVEKTGTR